MHLIARKKIFMNDDWEENFYKEIEKLREHDLEVTRLQMIIQDAL